MKVAECRIERYSTQMREYSRIIFLTDLYLNSAQGRSNKQLWAADVAVQHPAIAALYISTIFVLV